MKSESTVSDTLMRYTRWVESLPGRQAFRGHPDADWTLQSGAYRRLLEKQIEHPDLIGYLFSGYLHERVNEVAMRFSEYDNHTPLEVMAHLQYYGVATGLIRFYRIRLDRSLVCLQGQTIAGWQSLRVASG